MHRQLGCFKHRFRKVNKIFLLLVKFANKFGHLQEP